VDQRLGRRKHKKVGKEGVAENGAKEKHFTEKEGQETGERGGGPDNPSLRSNDHLDLTVRQKGEL